MRARQPDSSGYVVNDGVRVYYEVHGSGVADDPADAELGDHPVPDVEAAGALPGPALPGAHLRPARQRPQRPAQVGRGVRRGPDRRRRLAVMDATGTDKAVARRRSAPGPSGRQCCSSAPRADARPGRDRATLTGTRRSPTCTRSTTSRRSSTPTRAGPRRTGRTGSATGRATSSSTPGRCCPSRTRPRCATTWSGGDSTRTRRRCCTTRTPRARWSPMTVEERAELCRSITLPVLAIAGTEDADHPAGAGAAPRRADRR